MSMTRIRQNVERDIVTRTVDAFLAAGYRLAVSLERGYDIDEMLLGSTDRERIIEEAMAGDECHLFIQPATGPTTLDDMVVSHGYVYFVFGNSGWDVISDYTASKEVEDVLAPVNAYADTLAG